MTAVWVTVVCQSCAAGWWGPSWTGAERCPRCRGPLTVRGRTVVADVPATPPLLASDLCDPRRVLSPEDRGSLDRDLASLARQRRTAEANCRGLPLA